MPLANRYPDAARPFRDHGVVLSWKDPDRGQAVGDCPFCGAEGKFSVGLADNGKNFKGGWGCFPCGRKGNPLDFVRQWHEHCVGVARDDDYAALAADRRLMSPDTLRAWGVVRGKLTGDWLVPAYNARGDLVQLHYYRNRVLYGTAGLRLGLFGASSELTDPSRPDLHVCEGPWDGMALWEVLGCTKPTADGSVTLTGSANGSLRATANVVALPGASNWQDTFNPLAAGKTVHLMLDNDHPRESGGRVSDGAGLVGMRRAAELLAKAGERPAAVRYLAWGDDAAPSGLGGTYADSLPSGFDVRDALTKSVTGPGDRVRNLGTLLSRVAPIPDAWVPGRGAAAKAKGGVELECLPCTSYKALVNEWRKAMHFMDGLDVGLSVMLASALSTETIGEQLWFKVTGPPSCGKSILCEGMSVARKYVYPKDTFTGLTSGYQADKDGSQNMSLVEKIKNMTLIVNDADTIRTLANLPQVAAQLRTFFSRNIRSQYGNKMSADHEGYNCTIIFAGTEASHRSDSSDLGERFLDVVVVDDMPPETEREIARRSAYQALADCELLSDGTMESRDSPEMVRAKRMTGGYVTYLRENVRQLMRGVGAGEPEDVDRVTAYAEFVSFMRSRPPKNYQEKIQRELCFRVTKQLIRLSKCLAAILEKETIGDPEVVRRVRKVALDTARGRTLNLVRALYRYRGTGATKDTLARYTHEGPEGENKLLHHLKKLGATEQRRAEHAPGVAAGVHWHLTDRMMALIETVAEKPT